MQIRKEQIKGVNPLQIYNQNYEKSVSVGGTSDNIIIDPSPSYPASFANIGNSIRGVIRGKLFINQPLQFQYFKIRLGTYASAIFTMTLSGLATGDWDVEINFDIDFTDGPANGRKFFVSGLSTIYRSNNVKVFPFVNSSEGTVNVTSGLLFDATFRGGAIDDTFTCFKTSLMLVSSNILLDTPV